MQDGLDELDGDVDVLVDLARVGYDFQTIDSWNEMKAFLRWYFYFLKSEEAD